MFLGFRPEPLGSPGREQPGRFASMCPGFPGSLLFRMCRDVAAPVGSRLQKVPADIARSRTAFISLCQKTLMFPVLSQMRRDRVPPGVER